MSLDGKSLRRLPGNDRCTDCQDCDCPDCGQPDPVWACPALGIIVCEECMDIHRQISRHTFKSIVCQDWSEEDYEKMSSTSNDASKAVYEKHLLPAYRKPTRCFNVDFRRQWVISKYIHRDFVTLDNPAKYLTGQKTGYLWKLGRDGRIFHRRWVVLDSSGKGMLRYYTDADMQTLRGEITLFTMNLVLASDEKIGHPNGMQIVFPDARRCFTRIIYLYADLAKDMVEWYQAVRCLKYNLQKSVPQLSDEQRLNRIVQYDIFKEGYLFKTGTKLKGAFRKRWMILDKWCLMYFKEPLDANPRGTIPLEAKNSLIMSGKLDPEHRGYHFFLKTPKRTYHFVAETEHDRKAWFEAIHTVCNRSVIGYTTPRKLPVKYNLAGFLGVPALPETTHLAEDSADAEIIPEDEDSAEGFLPGAFAGVRPSTKPRPKDTMGQKRQAATVPQQRRYQTNAERHHVCDTTGEDELSPTEFQEIESSSDEECEESGYIDIVGHQTESDHKVGMNGVTMKQLSTYLKVQPGAIPPSFNCTMSINVLWTIPTLPQSDGYVCACPIVKCSSAPKNVTLRHPFQLEVQHSAILKDVSTCQPKVWYLNKQTDTFIRWEEALDISCQATSRTCTVTAAEMGSYAIMLPSPSVSGKILRCMLYMSQDKDDDHMVVRVYFTDDNGSSDILNEIQHRESAHRGTLTDISRSFCLANTADDVIMTLSNMSGIDMDYGKNDPKIISAHELWHKAIVCYIIEIIRTSQEGQCTVNVWQENSEFTSETEPVQMNLYYSNKESFAVVAPMPNVHCTAVMPTRQPPQIHKVVTRVQSDPSKYASHEHLVAERSREKVKSVPSRTVSTKPTETVPGTVKRDLSFLLDKKVTLGNDWRMLASQLRLDGMIEIFGRSDSPTIEVLNLFEVMQRPVKDLVDHLRQMDRDDAANVVQKFMDV